MAEKAAAGEGSVLGFLKIAKDFIDAEQRVYLKFPNEFAKTMVEGANIRDSIRAAICMETQKALQDTDLIFGVLDGNEQISDLDEFDV